MTEKPEILAQAKEIIADGCGCHRECEGLTGADVYCGCEKDAEKIIALVRTAAASAEPVAPIPDGKAALYSLQAQIRAIYGSLDAEDCAWIDREWMKLRNISAPVPASVREGYRTCPADGGQCLCDDSEALGCFNTPGSRGHE